MGVSTEQTNVLPLLLSTPAAAEFLGVSVGTIRRWSTDGLRFVRAGAGGKKMYAPSDLTKWIESLKQTAEAA